MPNFLVAVALLLSATVAQPAGDQSRSTMGDELRSFVQHAGGGSAAAR